MTNEEFAKLPGTDGEILIGHGGQFIPQKTYTEYARQMEQLCGEMIATFSIPRNRSTLVNGLHGNDWLRVADRWVERFKTIRDSIKSPTAPSS